MKTDSHICLTDPAHPRAVHCPPNNTVTSPTKTLLRRGLAILAAWSSLVCADRAMATVFTVTNANDSGPGSLRQAILDANASPGPDRIQFSSSMTIHPLSALPLIADALELDGGGNVIDLDASGLPRGLEINSGNCTVRGLEIHSANGSGIVVRPTLYLSTLASAKDLIANPGASTASGAVHQADLFDAGDAGRWPYNNPIPGGGGVNYAFRAQGTINVAAEGDYSFDLATDDGGELSVDGIVVVANPFTGGFRDHAGSIHLVAGQHSVEWIGFQQYGDAGFEVSHAVAGTPLGINNLADADALIASSFATTASSAIATADLADASYPSDGDWHDNNPVPGGGGDNYAIRASGTMNVTTAGSYTFALGSDDGGRLRIDALDVITVPDPRGFGRTFGTIFLAAGDHQVEWIGFESGGAAGFELSVAAGDSPVQVVSAAYGWHVLGAPSPSSGITLAGPLTVTAYYPTWQVLGALNPITGITLVGDLAVTVYYQKPLQNILIERNAITGNRAVNGGGIYSINASTIVRNCIISGNSAANLGGGMYSEGGRGPTALMIANSTISGNSAANQGGGILTRNSLEMTIEKSTVSNNSAARFGGGIGTWSGVLNINRSTISGNSSAYVAGGIDFYYGTLNINNSTLSGNSASVIAGGLLNEGNGLATLKNCTLSGNSAPSQGGGISAYFGPVILKNSIVANSPSGGTLFALNGYGGTITSLGYNLWDDGSLSMNPATGDLNHSPALLGPLQDNGGPTFTHALLAGSPAINAGDPLFQVVDLAGDQREFNRVQDSRIDIGAYEYGSSPLVTITAPASGSVAAVNSPVTFTGYFTPLAGCTYTAEWLIGGTRYSGTPNTATRAVSDAFAFSGAGVYAIELTVASSCGGSASANTVSGLPAYIVIYDPSAGFVTGGGWIDSPAGAYADDLSLTGKATFGFVSQYKKGATVPTGNTEFQFKAGNLNFKSTSYDWLVVSGARAQYKGTGTINGTGNHGFILTAVDGQVAGGGGADKFRVKIWDKATGDIVYDNQMGADDGAALSTTLGGGSIVIHK